MNQHFRILGLGLCALVGCDRRTTGAGLDGGLSVLPDSHVTSAPRILSLSSNLQIMHPADTLIVTAVVTDPDGIDDVIGGQLRDASGATYGAFQTSAAEGAYGMSLTWAALNAVAPIDFPAGG